MSKKRKIILIIVLVVVIIAAAAVVLYHSTYRFPAKFRILSDNSLGAAETEELKEDILAQSELKILVAYFSYSGTTKEIAEEIAYRTDADLFEIVTKESYNDVYKEANSEIRFNKRPELSNVVSDMEQYDVIFIGYPVWWHATPAPVNTFIESYDLYGKLIIPFCTSGGSDIEETMPTFLDSCDGLAVYNGKTISGTSELDDWFAELKLPHKLSENQIGKE